MQYLHNKLISRIYGKGRGWCFTPKSFSDLGTSFAVRIALFRLAKKGTIRRLSRGLYDYPKKHPRLGLLSPSADAVARALKSRDSIRLQSTGAYAANLLGLSDQVPMKVVFLTDGPPRHVKLGRQEIILKRTTPRNMATSGRISGLVIQSLRHLGQRHVDDSIVELLRHRLSEADKKTLLEDARYAPAWIAVIMRRIAAAEDA